jgi:hypothetical protein
LTKIGLGTMDSFEAFRDELLETAFHEWIINSSANLSPTQLFEQYRADFGCLGWEKYNNVAPLSKVRVAAKLRRRRSLEREVDALRASATQYKSAGMRLGENETLLAYATRILLGEQKDTDMKDTATETAPMDTDSREPSAPEGYELLPTREVKRLINAARREKTKTQRLRRLKKKLAEKKAKEAPQAGPADPPIASPANPTLSSPAEELSEVPPKRKRSRRPTKYGLQRKVQRRAATSDVSQRTKQRRKKKAVELLEEVVDLVGEETTIQLVSYRCFLV